MLLLAVTLAAVGGGRNLALAQTGAGAGAATGTVEVRVAASRLADGRTEFALQQRDADGSWGDRQLPSRRFFPAGTAVGRWLASSRLTVEPPPAAAAAPAPVVRVAAQLLDDGRMEFALQELQDDGSWSDRLLPRRRIFPAGAAVGRWLSSSPLAVIVSTPTPEPAVAVTTLCEGTPAGEPGRLPDFPTAGAFSEIPLLDARVVDLRFFEGGAQDSWDALFYTNRFDRATTRSIRWLLDLRRPAGRGAVDFVVETSIYGEDGSLLTRFSRDARMDEGRTSSSYSHGAGWADPGFWEPGPYRVELSVEGETIARGTFEVVDRGVPDARTSPDLYETLPWADRRSPTYEAQVALLALLGLREADPGVAASIVAMPWTQIEPGSEGLQTLRQLESLTCGQLELVRKLVALGWLADGVTTDEWLGLRTIALIAADNTAAAELVADYEWVRDGITADERWAIEYVRQLARAASLDHVASLTWLRQGALADEERWMLQQLADLAMAERDLAVRFTALPWLQDDVTSDERAALWYVASLVTVEPELGAGLVDFPWLQDDVSSDERWLVWGLDTLAQVEPDLADLIVGFPWLQDGVTSNERWLLRNLASLAMVKPDLAALIVRDLSPAGVTTMRAMSRLALDAPEVFADVLQHPTIVDGISDQETVILSTLGAVQRESPDLVQTLLDPTQTTLEERVIELPESGEVTLTIIRTRRGMTRSMDLLEGAARSVEGLLAASLPTTQVTYLFADAFLASFFGTHYGTHIAHSPRVDSGLMTRSEARQSIVHEVSHYYWTGNAPWVDEGLANLFATVVDGSIATLPTRNTAFPCTHFRYLSDLDESDPNQRSNQWRCAYGLGERLFRDLYHDLGDEFTAGLRRLYRKSQVDDGGDECSGTRLEACHVEAAFKEGASDEAIAAVDKAFDFWYEERDP